MNKSLQNKLKSYSALTAVSVVGATTAQAGIIHTDVNYTGGYETYDIDIDGNGITDFSLNAFSTNISYGSYLINIKQAGLQGSMYSNNILASGGSYFNSAQALSAGVYVYSTVGSFGNSAVLGGQFAVSVSFYGTMIPVYNGSIGNFGDGSEKFVGVQFDIDGDIHYGWLRFKDVAQDGSSWTLVDMAYKDEMEVGIKTGTTVGVEEASDDTFKLSSNGNQLNVLVGSEFNNSTIELIDLTGKIVLSQTINSSNTQVSYNLPEGIYIARLFNREKAITRKIKL